VRQLKRKAEQRRNDPGSHNGILPTTTHKRAPHSRDHHSATTGFSSDRAPRFHSKTVDPHTAGSQSTAVRTELSETSAELEYLRLSAKTLIFQNGSVFSGLSFPFIAREAAAVASRISASTETHATCAIPFASQSDHTDFPHYVPIHFTYDAARQFAQRHPVRHNMLNQWLTMQRAEQQNLSRFDCEAGGDPRRGRRWFGLNQLFQMPLDIFRYNGAYLAFRQRCTVQVLQKFVLA
jgi:hypothetical protein